MKAEWYNFKHGVWMEEINVRDFIKNNYVDYSGDASFLEMASEKTRNIWNKCEALLKEENEKDVLDIDVDNMASVTAFAPGYIDKDNEVIVGLQTDSPLKRIVNPYGGIRMVYQELESYGYKLNENIDKYFNEYRKTHNQGVFDAYTPEIKKLRHYGVITGLPDAYGRGRIIGDYRRIALYGVDYLMAEKKRECDEEYFGDMTDSKIRTREELSMQCKALKDIKAMALSYGFDISKPATNAKEAIQWTYFGYLAGVKENNGAAMSLGRVDSFFDIYINRDIEKGIITEEEAQ